MSGVSQTPREKQRQQMLEGHQDERMGVELLGWTDDGVQTDVSLTFRAYRATPYVTVQVQSESQGGESYDANNYVSRTRYNTIGQKQHSQTISRNDDEKYWVYLVPEVEMPPGCGTKTKYDGVDGEDRMVKVDLGKRTVALNELDPGVLRGLVEEDMSESDFDGDGVVEGRLSLTIVGNDTYDLQFYTRQGRGTGWVTAGNPTGLSSGGTASQDVELVEGKLSFIAYEILLSGTSTVLGRHVVVFDPDSVAEIVQLALALNGGTILAQAAGGSDTAKIYLTHTTDGSEPTDPTSANADQTIAARSGDATFGSTLPVGNEARVKARGENSDGQIAPAETIKEVRIERTSVGTDELENLAVTAEKLTESGRGFVMDVDFTAASDDEVTWGSGTIILADGTSYSIGSGTTGAMTAATYVYFDPSVSTTAFQTTTTLADATGERRVLVGVAFAAQDTSQEARFVSSRKVAVNEEDIAVNSITANLINVAQLSAIAADVGTLRAGLIQNAAGTNEIDLDATGTEPYILSPELRILADGTIQFGDASGTYSGVHERAFDEHDLVGLDANAVATLVRWRVTGTDLTDYEALLEVLNTDADPDTFNPIIRLGTDARPRFARPVQFGNSFTNLQRSEPLSVDGNAFVSGTVEVDALQLANHELGDFDTGGLLYHDASAGLYVKASNVGGDQVGGNLLWSSGNFTAGNLLSVSYDSEDEPTLAVHSQVRRVVHHGTGTPSSVGVEGTLHTQDA